MELNDLKSESGLTHAQSSVEIPDPQKLKVAYSYQKMSIFIFTVVMGFLTILGNMYFYENLSTENDLKYQKIIKLKMDHKIKDSLISTMDERLKCGDSEEKVALLRKIEELESRNHELMAELNHEKIKVRQEQQFSFLTQIKAKVQMIEAKDREIHSKCAQVKEMREKMEKQQETISQLTKKLDEYEKAAAEKDDSVFNLPKQPDLRQMMRQIERFNTLKKKTTSAIRAQSQL